MKFPFFSRKGSSSNDSFFGLFLKEHKGVGYIFSGNGSSLELLAKHEFNFSNGWENLNEDVDEVLFKLENETKCRIEKTIFFLFSHLIDDKSKEIKRPYLQKIKDLTKNLEIKPIGYIECYEAVVSFIQQRDSAPLTSILVELDDTNVDIFIYKGGHKISNHIVARTNSIIDDLHSVFDTLGKNTLLPNRVILYNSSSLVDESTKIISHRWSSDLFVQLPRVEILKEEDILTGLQTVFEQQIYHGPAKREEAPQIEQREVMGFMVGQDVDEVEGKSIRESFSESGPAKPFMGGAVAQVLSFTKGIKNPHLNIPKAGLRTYLLILGSFLFIVAAAAGFEFFIHKAQVSAVFSSTSIDKKIATDAVIDEDKSGYITVHVATASVDMKDVKITTGKRDVGEKSHGEVTLYNFDDKEKVFDKGTAIQVDNLSFTLDDEIKIPASTLASDASAKLPGKAKVRATASEIGSESNIDKGKRFKVADLSPSVYFALNDNGFSGGTRKTIKTVAKKDIDDLQSSLLEKAKKQLKDQIYKNKDKKATLIDSLMEFELSDTDFSKELGEEGENLTLNSKVVSKYYYFEDSSVKDTLKKEVEKEIPSGYGVEDKNFTYKVEDVENNKDNITFNLRLKAKATKKIDTAGLRGKLHMKQVSSIEDMLKAEYGAVSTSIEVFPPLPLIGSLLPFFDKNILLRIETQ